MGRREGGEFARRRVAEVAEQVHRLVIAENHDDAAARARRLLLQLLKAADDLQRIRLAVEDVAELDERRPAACPMAAGRRSRRPRGRWPATPDSRREGRRPRRCGWDCAAGAAVGMMKSNIASASSAMRTTRSSGDRAVTAPMHRTFALLQRSRNGVNSNRKVVTPGRAFHPGQGTEARVWNPEPLLGRRNDLFEARRSARTRIRSGSASVCLI